MGSVEEHVSSLRKMMDKEIDTESTISRRKDLKRTSYWLSEFQPNVDKREIAGNIIYDSSSQPERVTSPMSGRPLRMKDLIPCCLLREKNSSKPERYGKDNR